MAAPDFPTDSGNTTARRSELVYAAIVARRFYLGRLTKQAIADQLGISRFKVARLLDFAHEEGLIHIRVESPLDIDVELGQRLQSAFGLRDVWVLDADDLSDDELPSRLGMAAASLVLGLLPSSQPIGVAWGRTVRALADAMVGFDSCPIVQVAGGLQGDFSDEAAAAIVRDLAQTCGGEPHLLHAPLFVADRAIAEALRAEPAIRVTMERFSTLQTVLLGVGTWHRETSPVAPALSDRDLDALDRDEAVAEVCGLFLNQDGRVVGDALAGRVMAISAEELRAVPDVVAVAGGLPKAKAIAALARSKLAPRLVTDRSAAEAMLAI